MSLAKKIEQRRAQKPAPSDGDDLAVQIANLQRELAEARAKLGEHEKAASSWQQKAEQAEARYTSEKLTRHLYDAAIKAGAVDPDDVVSLVLTKGARLDGDRVVFGQGAEAKPADEYVSAFVEAKPHLRKSAPVAQGSGSPATQAAAAPAAPPAKPRPDTRDPKALSDHYRAEIAAKIAANKGKSTPAA